MILVGWRGRCEAAQDGFRRAFTAETSQCAKAAFAPPRDVGGSLGLASSRFDLEERGWIDRIHRVVAGDAEIANLARRETDLESDRRGPFFSFDDFEVLVVQARGQFVVGHHEARSVLVDDDLRDFLRLTEVDGARLGEGYVLGLPETGADPAIGQDTGRASVGR